ncbi:MAG TPA: hypothetical protein VH107_06025 [Lacipirellulaceae bacterium]|nr:hypothetical protein [Lacipirellulaceae bacterium]
MRVVLIALMVSLATSDVCTAARRKSAASKPRSIESLKLSETAKKAAEQLQREFPDIVFTSGRRELAEQAKAMAGNVVKKRDWIKNTYKANDASKACQKWVDDHPEARTEKAIAAGLLETLNSLGPKAGEISRHLTGDAFDIQPVKDSKKAGDVKAAIKELPGLKQFLDHEGGLEIWHVGF